MLRCSDPLPVRPQRVLVAGSSGAGKTTAAGRIGRLLDLPHTEIDGLYHGPDWVPRETFVADVQAYTAQPRWVTEWQYRAVRPLLLERADTLVWLHYPRWLVMSRLVRRTVGRRVRRVELWNGNLEPAFRTFFTDPEHIVRWGWRTFSSTAERVRAGVHEHPHLQAVELRSPRELDRWLEQLPRA